jgi:soluble lytic murein transglycosylase
VLLPPLFTDAVTELTTLPLRHEDAIRAQAHDKRLDPSLIAGVIYAESKFSDATSSAGALGLMQLMPQTAHFIAARSGGTAFTTEDLSTPHINIAYGSWYLRYLLDRYGGDEVLALAAYNGGMGNVDRWVAEAGARGERLEVADIPFPETQAYVGRVLDARRDYRRTYADELGLR